MAERQVTIADESFRLVQPFLEMATQKPVEVLIAVVFANPGTLSTKI
jgi:hypothetical protein